MFKNVQKWFSKAKPMTITDIIQSRQIMANRGSPTVTTYAVGSTAYGAITNNTYTTIGTTAGLTNITTTQSSAGTFSIGTNLHTDDGLVTFNDTDNNEIVRLNKDGTITWANGINIDEAAESFGKVVALGAEMRSGITAGTKRRMRDSVFADLIKIAKEKGSLTADDLQFILDGAKIMEKLSGKTFT